MPVWAHSGRELFFVDGENGLVAAQVGTDSVFQVGERETLFTLPPGYVLNPSNILYAVAPDDQQFLMARNAQTEIGSGDARGFVLVNNFFEELKRQVPN